MSKEEQYQKLCEINRVEGFDPAAFAVEIGRASCRERV